MLDIYVKYAILEEMNERRIKMNIEELEQQLKEEKEWLKECERNVLLSKAEIEHLESCLKEAKGESK